MKRVAGKLRTDQVRKRKRYFFRRSEAIFTVQNHAMTAIKHQYGGAGTLVFGLKDHEVRIIEFDRDARAVAAYGIEEGRADIQIQRIAKFISSGNDAGSNA